MPVVSSERGELEIAKRYFIFLVLSLFIRASEIVQWVKMLHLYVADMGLILDIHYVPQHANSDPGTLLDMTLK